MWFVESFGIYNSIVRNLRFKCVDTFVDIMRRIIYVSKLNMYSIKIEYTLVNSRQKYNE